MTPKFFFTYIGVFLTLSVILAALVGQLTSGFALSGKKPYVYGIFSSLVASGAAYLTTLFDNHMFSVFWFLAGIYFLFGIIHVAMVHQKYFSPGKDDKTKMIIGEILFGLSIIFLSIVIFSSLQRFLANELNFLFYPMLMSTITFSIPFLFLQTFEAAYNIPPPRFRTWKYPLTEPIELPDEKQGERILVIAFEIPKKTTDIKRSYFHAKAPETMLLGDLYYHFINDYNDARSETVIDFAEKGSVPHEWWFRRKPKWYQFQRILDPAISIRENGIKENAVIICERV